jgi:aldose 1-epimerase
VRPGRGVVVTEPGKGMRVVERELVLEAGDARLIVRPEHGGRMGSLTLGGRELLVAKDPQGPIYWGAYPMAPWAGRIANGRFSFAGREHHLPITMPPHAIHGVVYDRGWTVDAEDAISIDLDERWPYRGTVRQRFALHPDGLEVAMSLEAEEPQPAVIGWHPWFVRTLAPGAEPVRLDFRPGSMLVRGADGIPTGERVSPPEGPWDDAFTDLRGDPALEWPGQLRLAISSTCPWWVVYTMPEHAICVEPQSGPPDAANLAPEVVRPGAPLVHIMRWSWERLG